MNALFVKSWMCRLTNASILFVKQWIEGRKEKKNTKIYKWNARYNAICQSNLANGLWNSFIETFAFLITWIGHQGIDWIKWGGIHSMFIHLKIFGQRFGHFDHKDLCEFIYKNLTAKSNPEFKNGVRQLHISWFYFLNVCMQRATYLCIWSRSLFRFQKLLY